MGGVISGDTEKPTIGFREGAVGKVQIPAQKRKEYLPSARRAPQNTDKEARSESNLGRKRIIRGAALEGRIKKNGVAG